jgi:hypothetical protein
LVPKDVKALVERAVRDPEFRRRLLDDPEGVVQAEGYEISDEKLAEIKRGSEAPPEAIDAIVEQIRRGERRAG